MKKAALLLTLIVSVFLWSCGGSENGKESTKKVKIEVQKDNYKIGEKEALIVLKAYADKDLETLKSYAGGMQKMAMDDEYFKTNTNVNSFREKLSHWNGSFKEIRYNKDNINFQDYYYVTATFYESESGQLTAVQLKSTDKENWKLSGFGTAYLTKQEFSEMNIEIPE